MTSFDCLLGFISSSGSHFGRSRYSLFRRPELLLRCHNKKLHFPRLPRILVLLVFAMPACAQEFVPEQVVLPITDFKPDIKHLSPLTIKFGTGFCLDSGCRFVGTNYHAAEFMGEHVRIKTVLTAHRYLDSGPNDEGAQDIHVLGGGSLKYVPAHDLAIYEMRLPLKHFHGIGFDTDDLKISSEVEIYAYPFNMNPRRALVCWQAKFLGHTSQGLLAFSYREGRVGGASGGIVVDGKSKKIVGILSGIGDHEGVVLAVPTKELSDFVRRAQPYLQVALFPKTVFVSPVAADLYPPYVLPEANTLSQRPMEPSAVVTLRLTAQNLADSMRNFTAIQTFSWGRGNNPPDMTDAYETLIVDDRQRWRRPGSKKFHDAVPFPPLDGWIVPGGEWSELPERVGTELNLKIHQAPDSVLNGQTIHVFQYAAKAEDDVCRFRYILSLRYLLHRPPKSYDCHGEVWTDESGTILRISETFDLSGPNEKYRGVVTYGWLQKDGMQYLIPITITTQAEPENLWCRGLFTDYDMFGVKHRIMMPTRPEQARESTIDAQ